VEGSDATEKSRATKLAGTLKFIKANFSSAHPDSEVYGEEVRVLSTMLS
jgi:hypothetical protein